MAYDLFLFDADDTLLDFQTSEKVSLGSTLQELGIQKDTEAIYKTYRAESLRLWGLLEQGGTTKAFLRTERFRRTFETHSLDCDPELASRIYLEILPEAIHLVDHAIEICQHLSQLGEVGIITNGISTVQKRRLAKSGLSEYISFIAVSDESGFVKPDARFFEYATKMAKRFERKSTLMVGDRIEADIVGAHNFGIDSCLYNPKRHEVPEHAQPKYEIQHLSDLRQILI